MKLIFAGTPEFAASALQALVDAGHDIALVLTRADRPAGRGQRLQASPVKQLATSLGLTVAQPRTLRDELEWARLEAVHADAMIVAAYGLILPPQVLGIPRLGCLNIHASLLPRWRGAAPIQRAIEAGDAVTGITIMQMDEGLDTGPMLLARETPITADDTGGRLHDRLAGIGAGLIVEALAALEGPGLVARAQPQAGVTYAAKITKADTELDWSAPAATIADRVRAFDPFPGTAIWREGDPEPVKLWSVRVGANRPADAVPGDVVRADANGLTVACGEGTLALLELQRPGGRRLPVADFLRGYPVSAGQRFIARRAPTPT